MTLMHACLYFALVSRAIVVTQTVQRLYLSAPCYRASYAELIITILATGSQSPGSYCNLFLISQSANCAGNQTFIPQLVSKLLVTFFFFFLISESSVTDLGCDPFQQFFLVSPFKCLLLFSRRRQQRRTCLIMPLQLIVTFTLNFEIGSEDNVFSEKVNIIFSCMYSKFL